MDKYCGNCGHPLFDGAKFCANCGQRVNVKNENQPVPAESKKEPEKPKKEKQPAPAESKKEPVKAKNEEQDIATESKEEPVKTNAIVTKLQGIAKKKEGGFIAKLVGELIDFIQHPKKLLPTIVLTVFWTVFPILSAFGANIPVLRFLYTLTYSNGGMFGGLFGAVGGIFGKAVFAAVVNTIILSLIEKKNPFADGVKSLKQVFSKASFSGLSAISPFLIGAGTGLVLYWFFNITSSPVNCAVSVVAAVGAFSALGKKNGMLTSLVYFATGKLTKGKFPTQITVNRTITGFSAGFALGLPLTFVRFGWLLFLIGAILLTVGIVFSIIGKKGVKKMAATAAIFILTSAMMLPMFYTNVFATGENLPDGYVPMDQVFRLEDGDGSHPGDYSRVDGFYLVLTNMTSDLTGHMGCNAVYGEDFSADSEKKSTISDKPSFTVTRTENANGFTINGTYDWKRVYTGEPGSGHKEGDSIMYHSDLTLTMSNISFETYRVYADFNGRLNADGGYNDVFSKPKSYELAGTHVEGQYKFDAENDVVYIVFGVNKVSSTKTHATLVFRIDGVLPKNKTTTGGSSTAITQDDSDYKPYRGYLTYTNGETNKYGQPFPDLMDFNDDGEINWLDYAIQKELSHNPDWLDMPASKGAAAALAVITALLGAAGGVVGGALGGPLGSLLGSMAQAAGSAAEGAFSGLADGISGPEQKEDLGPYIHRDPDGDLEVNDPATGEKRVYVANGNGTYTNPLTGATYTPDELKASLESRAENAELIRQDDAFNKAAIEEQRAANQEKSWRAKQAEAENAAERAKEAEEAEHKEYVSKLASKYGVYSGDDEELYRKIAEKKDQEEIKGYEHLADEKAWKKGQEHLERVKKTSDVAIDIYAEIDPKTGKLLKNAYTVATAAASNVGDVMAGNKSIGGAIVQTAVDSGVELAKNYSDGVAQKMFTNTVGDSIKVMSDTYMKGGSLEKIREEGEKAAIQGAINATVDSVFDTYGDGVTEKLGLSGEDVFATVGGKDIAKETVGNIAKTVANTAAKDAVTFEDEDEAKLARLRAAQEQAEAEANAQAAQSFRKAQENGFERDWRESLPPDIRYKVDLAAKYGVFSGDDEELYQKIAEQQGQEEIRGYEHREIEKEWKEGQEHLERVKKGADVAFDIYAEVGGEAGKAAKDAYTAATAAASNMGDVMAGNKTVGGAIAQTVVDTGVELAKNHAEGTAQKLYTNIVGDGMKAMSDTYMKGGSTEDIQNAGKSAAIQGGINVVVEGVADKVGGKVTEKIGLSGEDVFATVGGKDIAKDAVGDVAKTIANTAAKDMATLADQDEVDLENLQEAQEQAEAAANAQAAQSFREAQEKWSENNDDDAGEDGK